MPASLQQAGGAQAGRVVRFFVVVALGAGVALLFVYGLLVLVGDLGGSASLHQERALLQWDDVVEDMVRGAVPRLRQEYGLELDSGVPVTWEHVGTRLQPLGPADVALGRETSFVEAELRLALARSPGAESPGFVTVNLVTVQRSTEEGLTFWQGKRFFDLVHYLDFDTLRVHGAGKPGAVAGGF